MARQQEAGAEVSPELVRALVMKAYSSDPHVTAIEAYAKLIRLPTGIGPANGAEAPEPALRAVGIRPAGEVVLPAHTLAATAEAAVRAGARHALVDVDAGILHIDTDMVGRAVGPRTQAIVPVHLFGQTAVEALVSLAVPLGSLVKYVHEIAGFNSRLGALQAIARRAKLQRLTRFAEYTYASFAPRAVKFRVLTTRVLDQGPQ